MGGTTPFHIGEQEAQARAGLVLRGHGIRNFMPDQHRLFFTASPYAFIAVRGDDGFPVATALSGVPGFIQSPDPVTLHIAGGPPALDPVAQFLTPSHGIGVLGLDFATRRRNRANGVIISASGDAFTIAVEQSFGNCPQYIQSRMLEAAPSTVPSIERLDTLDAEAVCTLAKADTFFVASAAQPGLGNGGVDISHRGGRPGFVKLDGQRLSIPDFPGNRYFNTLGNLLVEPRTALLFVDFARGDLLHLQGTATIDWHPQPARVPHGAQRVWHVDVTRGWRIRGALRWCLAFDEYAPTTEQTGIWPVAA
jgi:predicted pyridoxine 5'-phosphate oxidase superfamily flavin-nucleotide-binding protein